jgi:hypothetical protein
MLGWSCVEVQDTSAVDMLTCPSSLLLDKSISVIWAKLGQLNGSVPVNTHVWNVNTALVVNACKITCYIAMVRSPDDWTAA